MLDLLVMAYDIPLIIISIRHKSFAIRSSLLNLTHFATQSFVNRLSPLTRPNTTHTTFNLYIYFDLCIPYHTIFPFTTMTPVAARIATRAAFRRPFSVLASLRTAGRAMQVNPFERLPNASKSAPADWSKQFKRLGAQVSLYVYSSSTTLVLVYYLAPPISHGLMFSNGLSRPSMS